MAASGAGTYLATKIQSRAGGNEGDPPDWELDGIRVPKELIQGTFMTKLSQKKKNAKERLFRLDADQGRMYWPSRRTGVVYLENIKELRLGPSAHIEIRSILPTADISKLEDRWLTIIYTLEDEYKTLHLIAPTAELLTKWYTTLTQMRQLRVDFMGGVFHSTSSVGNELWERHHFAGADTSKDALLSYHEVKALCQRLNFGGSEAELRQRFLEVSKDNSISSSLTQSEFRGFIRKLKERPDIKTVFDNARGDKEFSFSVFEQFMKNSQKSTLTTAELESLYRIFSPTVESTAQVSPNSGSTTTPSKAINDLPPWNLDSFTAFLQSGYNSGFSDAITPPPCSGTNSNAQGSKVYQDMTQPLSSYFICSSHNTYLIGNQLMGASSVEGYIRSLLGGCRSVEMDIYDGPEGGGGYGSGVGVTISNSLSTQLGNLRDEVVEQASELEKAIESVAGQEEKAADLAQTEQFQVAISDMSIIPGEPIVTHGGTLTSSISVRRICEAIDRYGFVSSQYPVIISAEIHCGIAQQRVLVKIMTEVFGDKLVVAPVEQGGSDVILPSPEKLKGRILLKAKNKFLEVHAGAIPPDERDLDDDAQEEKEEDKKSSRRSSAAGSTHSESGGIREKATGVMDKFLGFMHKRTGSEPRHLEPSAKRSASKERAVGDQPAKQTTPVVGTKAEVAPSVVDPAKKAEPVPNPAGQPPPSLEVEAPTGEKHPVNTSSTTNPTSGGPPIKLAMAKELLPLLVYTAGVTFRGLGPQAGYKSSQVFSLSENRAKSLIHNPKQPEVQDSLKSSAKDSTLLVEHTRGHLVRVYPKGTRVDSSNYEPNVFWAMGCQLVTQNWQTVDRGWHMNRAMFLRNGGAGYLLKPPALLNPSYPSDHTKHKHTKHVLRIRIISAQQLPRPKDHQGYEVIDNDTVDPYVKAAIHIPIWASGQTSESIAPVAIGDVPKPNEPKVDQKPGELRSKSVQEEGVLVGASGAGDEQAGAAVGERVVTAGTRTIRNNGFNPIWDEELKLPFDVFGEGMKDLVFIRILVKDDNNMDKDDFVGGYCTSLGSLEMGYRHIPLYDEQVSQILFAGLLVHVSIDDL